MIKIGSHVSMNGKEMLLASAREAVSYDANTFMVYTGAPQNTRRKKISELNIEAAWDYMHDHGIKDFIIHAPYIINLGNTIKTEIFQFAVDFLKIELQRGEAMGSNIVVMHPGSHIDAGVDAGIEQIVKGLNQVLTTDTGCFIALETMAGKGSEVGKTFEELARIYDGVIYNERLRVCFDTCHVHDAGYDIINSFDEVIDQFDKIIGKDQIQVFHINDSKNICGARKDRHANIGAGEIGFEALHRIVHHPDFLTIPKILETPYIEVEGSKNKLPPYKEEIARLLEK